MTDERPEPVGPEEERRLRLALRLIGEEVGRAEPEPAGPPRAARRRRREALAGPLALAAALALGVLAVVTANDSGDSDGSSDMADRGGRTLRDHEWVACSTMILEGDVLDIRPTSGLYHRELVTLRVGEWIKPAEGPAEVELNLVGPRRARAEEPLRVGEHVLLMVPVLRDDVPDVFRGDRIDEYRDVIERALPRAENTECPDFWLNPDDQPPLVDTR